jgi:hypothetical protein
VGGGQIMSSPYTSDDPPPTPSEDGPPSVPLRVGNLVRSPFLASSSTRSSAVGTPSFSLMLESADGSPTVPLRVGNLVRFPL